MDRRRGWRWRRVAGSIAPKPRGEAAIPDHVHGLIAAVYDGVFNIPLTGFQRFALDQLAAVVAFDSAVWINGVSEADQVHSCVLVNQPEDLIPRYMAGYAGIDLVRNHAVRHPARAFRIEDTMPLERYRGHPAYRDFWSVHGIEHAMAIALTDPVSQLMELIVLWRADAELPFSGEDVAALEVLAPHVVAGWRHRQLAHLHEQASTRAGLQWRVRGNAVCDSSGVIYASDPQFNALIRAHFAGWQGPALPPPLVAMVAEGAAELRLAGLDFALDAGAPRSLLTVSVAEDAALTASERRVAALYAEGRTNGQIAEALGVTQSTVRNQISAAYRKLDIHSKAELARRIAPR
jgi:DNA-binding CsgD family transcriptional regulator